MKFYVIYKPQADKRSVVKVEGENIKKIEDVTYEGTPFMIVAAEPVALGDIYQAIQINENKVQLNYKPTDGQAGHKFVEAKSIAEALGKPEGTGQTPIEEEEEEEEDPEQGQGGNTPDPTPDPEPETPFVSETYTFESYNADGTVKYATGTAKTLESNVEGKTKIEIETNEATEEMAAAGHTFPQFVGKIYFIANDANDGARHPLFDEDGVTEVEGLSVKITGKVTG